MPTAAIYARVSTLDQNHDLQTNELRSYCQRMGWDCVEFTEKASSVKKRPVFNRMMEDARLKRFDVVVVWKLDRFARSLRQLCDHIASLDSYGVRFLCLTQQIDTDKQNAAGRLMMQMLGAFAEFERSIIVERTVAGLEAAKRRGVTLGRRKRIFRRDLAFDLRAQGLSYRRIAAELEIPVMTVVDALKSKTA